MERLPGWRAERNRQENEEIMGAFKKAEEKVIAVTVTFNRVSTLQKTIHALESQTVPVWKIVIVDNSSNEETGSSFLL